MTVSLTTPNHDDGAILFELTGPATIRSIAPANDIVARNLRFFIDSSSATIRIVAAGLLSNSPLLRFVIADTTTLSSYAATVKDVADSRNVLRSSLTGYALTITH